MRTSLLILVALALAGCTTTGGDCTSFAPIRPSAQDVLTPGTASQLLVHNETGARNCGWRP